MTMYNSVLHQKKVRRQPKRPTKGHMAHPASLVDQFKVNDLVEYYKVKEASQAAQDGTPLPKTPAKPYGNPLSTFADYKAHVNYVGKESAALGEREAKPPAPLVIKKDDKGRTVLVDHTGKVFVLDPGSASDTDSDDGFPVSAETGVRYMSYTPAVDDPKHEDYQDEWVSTFGKLKAEAKRRHQHELLVEKLGYDPDDVKHNSKRYTKSRTGTRRRQGNKRHPAGSHRAASPLRAAATTATRASGRAPKARAQRRRKPGIVSQYNQRALRPDLVKKPVALTPFVDADTGEALTPNNIGLQSPRDQVKARRHEIGPPVVIESIGDLEALKTQHEKTLLALIGSEWRREGQRIQALKNERFEHRKQWLKKRFEEERAEVWRWAWLAVASFPV